MVSRATPINLLSLLLLLIPCAALAQPSTAPVDGQMVMLDPAAIAQARQRVAAKDPAVMPAWEQLQHEADAALKREKFPTVMDKAGVAPNGDKHDYVSVGVYLWPDPSKPDGKPWVYKDGQYNTEQVKKWDADAFRQTTGAVRALAYAYAVTGEEQYADKAAKLLRAWFLDPATKMNPNLDHGQMHPGHLDGANWGIIETREIGLFALDPASLLQGSSAWTPADQQGMIDWTKAYLEWLENSKLGTRENNGPNNHAIWFDAQAAWMARWVGNDELARKICQDFGPKRLAKMVAPDGSLPEELKRTRSFHYSIFTLQAMYYVGHIGRELDVDVYGYRGDDGRSFRAAIDYMLPYITKEKPWERPEITAKTIDTIVLRPLLLEAAKVYGDSKYEAAAGKLFGPQPAKSKLDNLFGTVTND